MTCVPNLSPEPESARRDNIWSFAQNKPSLVARDLLRIAGVPIDITYRVLVARGVFKWLAVRRDLIKLKNVWRDEITRCLSDLSSAKARGDGFTAARLRGRIEALNSCRQAVRSLCHSERWRAPDFDRDAQRWLEANG